MVDGSLISVLGNEVVAVRIGARHYARVDLEDVPTVMAYTWQVRAIMPYNGYYKGAFTTWLEQDPEQPDEAPLRKRIFLHDLLMETPEWVGSNMGYDGPRVIVEHLDGDGLNCTRANMRFVESDDGWFPAPRVNLPRGIWWNYRRHQWMARIFAEGDWYIDIGRFDLLEDALEAYHTFEMTPEKRRKGVYAHGSPMVHPQTGYLMTQEEAEAWLRQQTEGKRRRRATTAGA